MFEYLQASASPYIFLLLFPFICEFPNVDCWGGVIGFRVHGAEVV